MNHTAVKQTHTPNSPPAENNKKYDCYGNNKPCRELCNNQEETQCLKAAMQYIRALHREE